MMLDLPFEPIRLPPTKLQLAIEGLSNGPELWDAVLAHMPPGAFVAGGAVRDYFLGIVPKDIDVFFDVQNFPKTGLDHNFCSLGSDKSAEYEAMKMIAIVQRAVFADLQIDVVGVHCDMGDFTEDYVINGFDVGIARSWWNGQMHDRPEAFQDRVNQTVTVFHTDRRDRTNARFDRFNARMGAVYRLVDLIHQNAPYGG